MKVIVVDGEEDIQLMFREKFREEVESGLVELHFAISVEAALDYLQKPEEESVVLVISNIKILGMDGLETLKPIKQTYPKLKVFMITAYLDEQNFKLAMTHEADDYTTKLVNLDSLKKHIQLIGNLQQLINQPNMPFRILVVDDEPAAERLINQAFRRKIRDREYQFFFPAMV